MSILHCDHTQTTSPLQGQEAANPSWGSRPSSATKCCVLDTRSHHSRRARRAQANLARERLSSTGHPHNWPYCMAPVLALPSMPKAVLWVPSSQEILQSVRALWRGALQRPLPAVDESSTRKPHNQALHWTIPRASLAPAPVSLGR